MSFVHSIMCFFVGGGGFQREGAATEKAVSPQVRHLCGGPSTGICFPAVGVSGIWWWIPWRCKFGRFFSVAVEAGTVWCGVWCNQGEAWREWRVVDQASNPGGRLGTEERWRRCSCWHGWAFLSGGDLILTRRGKNGAVDDVKRGDCFCAV